MAWIDIAKPSSSNYTNVAKPTVFGTISSGSYMGPLGLTYSEDISGSDWVNINKPSSSSWTNIAKPT